MNHRTRALVYVRKSMVRRKRDEISPERQLANCLAAVESHGWHADEGDIYQDAEGHRSGRSEEHRPAWRALKQRVKTDPTVVAVVVNSLDRSSRSPKDFFNFLDLVKRHEVEIVSVIEQFDTSTAIGRAFLAILMVVASLESDLASERTTSTIGYLKGLGTHWGYTPYGYTRDDDAIPQPDDNAAAVVEALTYYAQGDKSYGAVARYLNRHPDGFRWRDRKREPVPFTSHSIRSIVSNVLIYAGWVPVGRGKDMQITDEANTLEDLVRLTHASEGLHPPLIDEALANRVLAARHKRVFLAVRRADRTYILTPMLHCANCGEMLRGKVGRRSDTGPRYCHYGSTHACLESSGLDPEIVDGSHDAHELEERVLAMLNGIRLSGAIVTRLSNAVAERVRTRPGNEVFQEQIEELRRQQERLRDTYVLGDTPRDQYLVLRAEQERRIRELERQLGGADYPLETTLARINQLGDRLNEGTTKQRKQALSLMFSRISVSLTGEITEVEPQPWVQPLFVDLVALSGDNKCPQGNSNPCRRLERAVS
jgi:DNA invertase Pin-like site-specific DNA recombinase